MSLPACKVLGEEAPREGTVYLTPVSIGVGLEHQKVFRDPFYRWRN